MRTFTKFSIRFAAYLLVVAYLIADLFIFSGPLNRRIQASNPNSPEAIAAAKANGVIARVFNHHITRKQLQYAVHERLWLEGKTADDLSPGDLNLVTYAALGDLIDHQLLRVKVKLNTHELPVSEEETETRFQRFAGKFESEEQRKTAMKSMGIPSETALRNRISARIQQEKYVAMRVAPLVAVTDEEVSEWFQENKDSLEIPERIRASHIFVGTLAKEPDAAKQILEQALAELEAGTKDFATLASEISEDPATKTLAGDLGWMSKARLPADFAEQVFPLTIDKPELIRTKLGWHLVKVTERKPAEAAALDTCKPDILAALTASKRHQAVNDFRAALRRFEAHKIDIFHEQLNP